MKKNGLIIAVMVGVMSVLWFAGAFNQAHHDGSKRVVKTKKIKQLTVKKLTTTASAAVVLNRDTGQLVGTKNSTQPLAIASISKLMTGYLTLEKLAMTDMIKPSANTVKIGEEPELAAVPLDAATTYRTDDLLNAALQLSANDAAIALGDEISGSQLRFTKLMTATAKQWDIKTAKWYNAAGIRNDEMEDDKVNAPNNAENMMSAIDVAKMSEQILKHQPKIIAILGQTTSTFNGTTQASNFSLMNNYFSQTKYQVTGGKLGVSVKSGVSFVGFFTYKKHHYVTVVLHADQYKNLAAVFRETKRILDEAV
ncbi:D-alanyl-D-alanine carboxypeptidase [Leuconostoc falkenbergense]|uniref:D-alanyl-D-alanine carboxypeptidase family protein n=2 Tax=Leuconostoc falkenbergense TaxID=2766470 RepID=UPI001669DA75|nr:D-alanyl-D-alanine carboxypeptidase [Leuconostoc falkenbergense]MCT4404836.1 D-alanyl-D-alanine carboxypeptidase [Leuconostoc falkenbergense]